VLILVRHGRTASNAAGRLLGRDDPPLDDVGVEQAAAVARRLGLLDPTTRVITSPLRRARATADVIAGEAATVEVDQRWIELDYGTFEGTPLHDVGSDIWARWRADPDFTPPGGESLRSVRARVEEACAELMVEAAQRDVIVVSHVSPIKAAVVSALGVGDEVTWRMFVAPCSVTRISARAHGPVLVSFNEVPLPPPYTDARR
jgi:broad specificity phosphatase PhoE